MGTPHDRDNEQIPLHRLFGRKTVSYLQMRSIDHKLGVRIRLHFGKIVQLHSVQK